jgi:hypothetical protein
VTCRRAAGPTSFRGTQLIEPEGRHSPDDCNCSRRQRHPMLFALLFMRLAGTVHNPASRSISSKSAPSTAPVLLAVRTTKCCRDESRLHLLQRPSRQAFL